MNNETPEAALRSRIADLEQQLKSADEGVSRLASRCLALEKEVESYRAAHPQREMHTDSPTLLQPLLYYDAGFGFSERDTLTAPDYVCDELTGAVTATFELPVAAQALRVDPGELPCCITGLLFLEGVQYFQKNENREQQHLQQLEQNAAAQQQTIAALQKSIAELHQTNAELQAHCQAYENSLQGVLSSSSWRLTSPFRRLLGWFHRGQK